MRRARRPEAARAETALIAVFFGSSRAEDELRESAYGAKGIPTTFLKDGEYDRTQVRF